MKYSQIEILEILKKYFQQKADHYHIQMAFLYGSWAANRAKPGSDIDIAVVFEETLNDEDEIFNRITDIALCLTRELRVEISILPLMHDFKKPMLYYNAIVHSIPVFIADFNKYCEIKNQAIYQMEDFSIFGIGWQREVTKKNLEDLKNA